MTISATVIKLVISGSKGSLRERVFAISWVWVIRAFFITQTQEIANTLSRREPLEPEMTNLMTVAEMVIRALRDQGVDTIFGYPGGAVLPIYDALFHQTHIK